MASYMDISQALYQFWSQFSYGGMPIPAYRQGYVPEDANGNVIAPFPYITFSANLGDFNQGTVLTAFVWCRQTEGLNVNAQRAAILDQIAQQIPAQVGRLWRLANGGAMWLSRNVEFLSDYTPPTTENNATSVEAEPIIGGRISYILRTF